MEYHEFIELCKEFKHIADEYMDHISMATTNGDHDDFSSVLKMTTPYTQQVRELTLIPYYAIDGEGEAVIDLGDDNHLSADATGLYVWLWHESESQLRTQAERIKRLESFLRSTVNDGGASKNLKDCARDLLTESEQG